MAKHEIAMLKALADESRFKVVELLAERGECCACDLLDELAISQPTLSHHMKILADAQLVHFRRAGKWCYYKLDFANLAQCAEHFQTLASQAEASQAENPICTSFGCEEARAEA